MEIENLKLLAQLIDSEENACNELEQAFKERNSKRIKEIKEEFLNLQKQISKILG